MLVEDGDYVSKGTCSCYISGSILITGTTQLTAKDIQLRLLRSQTKCVITDEATAEKVDQVNIVG